MAVELFETRGQSSLYALKRQDWLVALHMVAHATVCDVNASPKRLGVEFIQCTACKQNDALISTPDLTIQRIEFTFTYDKFCTSERRQVQGINRRSNSTKLKS